MCSEQNNYSRDADTYDNNASRFNLIFCYDSLSDETCSQHKGYKEFRDRVRSEIEQGLDNDVLNFPQLFSKIPGFMTESARKRVEQFKRRFTRVFNAWYVEVTKKGPKKGRRQCLTENFPYDSPGNPDTILGLDCALDLKSVDSICHNLKRLFKWSNQNCSSGYTPMRKLEKRCWKIYVSRRNAPENPNALSIFKSLK